MTSIAFAFGSLPLAIATGASAASRIAIGTAWWAEKRGHPGGLPDFFTLSRARRDKNQEVRVLLRNIITRPRASPPWLNAWIFELKQEC